MSAPGIQYGLIGAGPIHRYLISDLPRLSQELGPVAAINRRTASRIVNTLRAGEACDLDDIGSVSVILVCAPGAHLQSLLLALQKSKVAWVGKSLVLCQCGAFSRELDSLRKAGASIASLRNLPGLPGRFLVEGERDALRGARYVVHQLGQVPVEIRPDDYLFYLASETLAGSLLTPLLESCMLAIRRTRLSGAHSAQIVEALVQHTLRNFLYSGRKSWAGVVAEGDWSAMELQAGALGEVQAELADVYRTYADCATRLLRPRSRITKRPENS